MPRSLRVLVVDDDQIFARGLARRFELAPTYASTVEEGLRQAAKTRPQVLLLDNQLPDGRGADEIKRYRAAAPDALLVVLSAWSGEVDKETIEKGANGILSKLDVDMIGELLEVAHERATGDSPEERAPPTGGASSDEESDRGP